MNFSCNSTVSERNGTVISQKSLIKYITQWLYVVAGLACAIGNLLVILVICQNKKLRGKIFYFLASLAIADTFKGVAYLVVGSRRIRLLNEGEIGKMSMTSFDCMQQFSTTMFILGPQAINLMTVIVSLDRFLAIAFPLKYARLNKKYVWSCVVSCWLLVSISYVAAWIGSSRLPRVRKYSKWCVAAWSFSPTYDRFMFGFEAASTWICFVLLVATFLAIKCPRATNTATMGRPSYYRRQIKVAKMVVISLSFLVFLWVIPTNAVFVMTLVGRTKMFDMRVAPILWLMVAFSGCTNVFVYAWLNKRIRSGVKDLFNLRRVNALKKKAASQNPSSNFREVRALTEKPITSGRSSSNYRDM